MYITRRITLFLLLVLVFIFQPVTAQDETPPAPQPAIPRFDLGLPTNNFTVDLNQRTKTAPQNPTLSSDLDELASAWAQGSFQTEAAAGLNINGDSVQVTFSLIDAASADQLVAALPMLGGTVTAHYKSWVDAWVPVAALAQVSTQSGVQFIRPVSRLIFPGEGAINPQAMQQAIQSFDLQNNTVTSRETQAGTVLTQGVAASNADDWHAAGFTGAGINIGIIGLFDGYFEAIDEGELPADLDTYGVLRLDSASGTGAAEVVYDMAPDANLTFASAYSATELASLIVDLASFGNDTVFVYFEYIDQIVPNDGTGPVADAINDAQNIYGTFVTTFAGSYGEINYVGEFCDCSDGKHYYPISGGGVTAVNIILNPADANNNLPAGQEIIATLRWSDWPTTDQDYDLILVRWDGAEWDFVDALDGSQTGSQPPMESGTMTTLQSGLHGLVIEQFDGTDIHTLELRVYVPSGTGSLVSALLPLNYTNRSFSLSSTAGSPEAFSANDVDVTTYTAYVDNSQGPTLGLGGVIDPVGYNQPRISDYGGVNTYTFGASNFKGGGAHVAGAAALVLNAYPNYTPAEIKTFLQDNAIDLDVVGPDYLYGYGRLYLGSAPVGNATPTPTPTATQQTPGDTPTPTATQQLPGDTPTPTATQTTGGCVGTQTICRISPADNTVMDGGSDYVPRFRWEHLPQAQWYNVFIATPDFSTIFLNAWYRASQVCSGDVCSIPADVWLVGSGEFAWWMSYYYDGMSENYLTLYEDSSFSITMPLPGGVTPLGPTDEVIGGTGVILQWQAEPNALWYQIWAGPADYSDTVIVNWYDARNVCENSGVCSIVVPRTFQPGDQEFWLQAWNPRGITEWALMSAFTVVAP